MSELVDIADGVVTHLNSGAFEPEFTAVRAYQPTFDLPDLADLQVSVVPKSISIDNASRSANAFEYSIAIGIQQKISELTEVDVLMDLVQAVMDYLRFQQIGNGLWIRIENDPAIAVEHLDQQRVFTSVITVVYSVHR